MSDLAAQLNASERPFDRTASGWPAPIADNSAAPRVPWHARPIRLIIICGIILVGVVIAATVSLLSNLYNHAIDEKARALESLALVLAEQIDRSFQSIELIQTSEIERMQSLGIASAEDFERQMSGYDTHRRLNDRVSALPFIDAIVLTDSQGKLINFSRSWPIPHVNIPDRDPSEVFRSDPHLTSFVGEPIRSPATGRWVVPVVRKVSGPNGAFLGVVTGVMDLQYFEQIFQAIASTPNGSFGLFRRDGTLLVRYPRQEAAIGQPLAHSNFMNVLAKSDHGTNREISVIDGQERLISDRSLAHYPVVLVATTTVADALANWKRGAIAMIGAALIIGLVIGGIVALSIWQVGKKLREQNLQRNTALNNMSQGLVMFDSAAQLTVCNYRYRQIYNFPPDFAKPGCALIDLLKYRVADGTFSGNPEKHVSALLATITQGKMAKKELETGDGRIISVAAQPMESGGWVATHEDITEQRRAARELDETRRFLDSIIENIPIAVVVKDAKTRKFVLINRAFEAMHGPRRRLLGKTVFDVYSTTDAEVIDKSDSEYLQGSVGVKSNDYEVETPLRGSRIVSTKRIVICDSQGDAKYLIVVIEDITERKKSEQRIAFMAHHDALTGLANRAAAAQKIEDAAARQRRWGDSFTVLLLDLDRFKHVNDTLGHPAGDAMLREVATRLKACLRETDMLARLGGDEFVIIQAGETNQREAASVLVNRIFEIFAKAFNIDGNEINITTSIGIALAPAHASDSDNLLKMADLALYRAKLAGRNGYRFFDPEMSSAENARHEIENELRRAIQQDELELHYQPIIDTKTGRICSVEALVRWRHPTKGMISPDRFIPLAEETGLITQIGEWVLHTACIAAATWPASVKVAVNLSPVQFCKTNLSGVVMYALAESGLPPERLELEITETALIESAAECLPALHQFKSLGIAVALDDFGTGYSSLSQLTLFPFDKIKIDKSFTQNLTKRADCAAIISATLTLAQSLDIATTAEGVETTDQYRLLRLAGVTSLQGYLFKRPGPACEIDFDSIYRRPEMKDAV
jgi:diguanylate cyclase (GGDEF)-like protein/PAS domain S-box-containing protein